MIVKISYIVLIALLIAVILNSVYVTRFADTLYSISSKESGDDIESYKSAFERIENIYDKNEIFVSLTVSHEDLTSIKDSLAEISGALLANDKNSVIIAKSRLESALLHLGQLSAFNIESIF